MSKRVSLILKDVDEAVIAPYLDEDSAAFEVLRQWAVQRGETNFKSEAAALRALLQAGAEAIGEDVIEAGYACLAGEFNSDHADAERKIARDRLCASNRGVPVNLGVRGQVCQVDLGHGLEAWVIVSNNARNRNLDTVLAARIVTTSENAHVPTVVALSAADPLVGFVLVDDLVQLHHDELTTSLGALSPSTMHSISAALRIAMP